MAQRAVRDSPDIGLVTNNAGPDGQPDLKRLAIAAQSRKAWPAAIGFWRQLLALRPTPDVHTATIRALGLSGAFGEAACLLDEARRRFGDIAALAVAGAELATLRGDLQGAEAMWMAAIGLAPADQGVLLGYARFFVSTGRPDLAAPAVDALETLCPHHRRVTPLRAQMAAARGDWREAARLWGMFVAAEPGSAASCLGLVEAFVEQGDLVALAGWAEHLAAAAPDSPAEAYSRAMIIMHRGELVHAVQLWREAARRFPAEPRMGKGLMSALSRIAELSTDDGAAPPGQGHEPSGSDAQALAAFQSLGDTCEFGNVQRAFGLEPLGLLRWSTAPLAGLIDALASRFEGVGEPAQTSLQVERGEYRTADTRYGMAMHTFRRASEADAATMLPKLCARLRFLRRKLLADLACDDALFLWRASCAYDDAGFRALDAAMRPYGRAKLLIVIEADAARDAGSIGLLTATCAVGAVPWFSISRPDAPAWLDLCVTAERLLAGR